jgi:hypothetical protein
LAKGFSAQSGAAASNLTDIGDYELVVTLAGSAEAITTFVATRQPN